MNDNISPEKREAIDHITTLKNRIATDKHALENNPADVCGQHTSIVMAGMERSAALTWIVDRVDRIAKNGNGKEKPKAQSRFSLGKGLIQFEGFEGRDIMRIGCVIIGLAIVYLLFVLVSRMEDVKASTEGIIDATEEVAEASLPANHPVLAKFKEQFRK